MQTLAKTYSENYLISKSFLQSGKPLQLTNTISCKHPTVQEVLDIDSEHFGLNSEKIYYSMVDLFLTDPYIYMVYLDDNDIDYEKTNSFEVFVLLYTNYIEKIKSFYGQFSDSEIKYLLENNIYSKAFKFFFGIDKFYIALDEDGNNVFAYDNGLLLFDRELYAYIEEFIKRINGIPEIDKIFPDDDMAKQILLEDERDKLKKRMKSNSTEKENTNRLGDLLSNVTWASQGGITPFNRNELHMFDLIDGFHKTDKLLNYKNTMTGLYSGCIDNKKINMKEIHWSTE